jgi:D-methionine transport system ATP-binding protein
VAIARALANDPGVLLCDECTSALDPQTTAAILKLLKELNKKLGLTIVIITHEMAVAKEICDRVAVMDGGRIVEVADTVEIFANPQHGVTQEFVNATNMTNRVNAYLNSEVFLTGIDADAVILKLRYGKGSAKQALISEISRTHHIDANILFGNIDVIGDATLGNLVDSLSGKKTDVVNAVATLSENNVVVEVIRR